MDIVQVDVCGEKTLDGEDGLECMYARDDGETYSIRKWRLRSPDTGSSVHLRYVATDFERRIPWETGRCALGHTVDVHNHSLPVSLSSSRIAATHSHPIPY